MVDMSFITSFSILLVMLVTAVLFVYARLRSSGGSYETHGHLDLRAGDEGAD